KFDKVITLEDGAIMGGMGSAILEFMADNGYSSKVIRLGIPDHLVEHGSQKELYEECGFHPEGIYQSTLKLMQKAKAKV
ncbi:MAG: 1-deoxy-D-xylulose-5-phosphate synthase, partial [Sphingobacteriales bacterium]